MKFRILCTDGFSKAGIEELKRCPLLDVELIDKLAHEELLSCIADYDALIVRSASHVSRDVIERGARLKVVARAGVGTDNIDLEAATERGILVVNAPAGNSTSTAELAFAMIIALARHIPQAARAMSEGRWEKKKFQGSELAYKTLGIVGLGRIGRVLARRAQAFDMKVMGYDPYLSAEKFASLGVVKSSLEDIYRHADYISVHTPLTAETTNMIGASQFAMMKPTVRLINCARGGIIDEEALAQALKEGRIGGAALDVFTEEPFTREIFKGLDNVILTPHLGASTAEAQEAVAREAANAVVQFFTEGLSQSAVNLPAEGQDLKQYRNHILLSEKLGALLAQLTTDAIDRIAFCATVSLPHILTLAAIKGVLSQRESDTVTLVNAANVAQQHSIGIAEEVLADQQDFAGAIGVKIGVAQHELEAWGAILPDGTAKITGCMGYRIEVDPAGTLVFIQNYDQPGVIGRVSTALGENGVNIAEMQNVRHDRGGEALTIIRVDGEIPQAAFEQITKDPGIKRARIAHL